MRKRIRDEYKQGEDIMKCTKCGNEMNCSGMDFGMMNMIQTKNMVSDAIEGVGAAIGATIGAAAGLVIAGVKGALVGAVAGGVVGSLFGAEENRSYEDENSIHEENDYSAAESRGGCNDSGIKDSDASSDGVEAFKDKLIDRHICTGCKYMFFA